MWYLVICLMLTLLLKIVIDRKQSKTSPPGPRAFPIIGSILEYKRLVKESKFQCLVWCRLAELYGPIVRLKFVFGNPWIVVSGKSAVMEMLSRPEFDGRPDTLEFRIRSGGKRRGVIFTHGEVWFKHRRLTEKTLKRLSFNKTGMEDMVVDDAIALTKKIEKLAEKGPISNLYKHISISIIASPWQLVTGVKSQSEDSKVIETIAMLNTNMKETTIIGSIINQIPFLKYIFPRQTGYTKLKNRQDRLWKYFQEMIKERKKNDIQNEPNNLIDVYLKEMQNEMSNSKSCFDEDNLTALIKDIFVASVETTSSIIGFTIAYLAVHQDVQKKVHDELDEVLGRDTIPRLIHKNRLPYLQAILAEVSRVGNVVATSLPHRAMSDATFLGYHIKKNTVLLANFMSIHMDEKHWGDPKAFRPERFINEKGEYVNDPWVMIFGSGRRRCLGEGMAKNSLFLFVAHMLQKFHFSIAPGHPKPCLMGINGFIMLPPPITLLVTKRT